MAVAVPKKAYDEKGKEHTSGLPTEYVDGITYHPLAGGCDVDLTPDPKKEKGPYNVSCPGKGCAGDGSQCRTVYAIMNPPSSVKAGEVSAWKLTNKLVYRRWQFAKADTIKIEEGWWVGCVCAKQG